MVNRMEVVARGHNVSLSMSERTDAVDITHQKFKKLFRQLLIPLGLQVQLCKSVK